jgi:hypothetical protein
MNIAIFCNIEPYVNRRFGGTYLQLQGRKSGTSVYISATRRFLVRLIFDFENGDSSETSIHIQTTRRNIPEYGSLLR